MLEDVNCNRVEELDKLHAYVLLWDSDGNYFH